jgi:flagellar motor switch protein FliG
MTGKRKAAMLLMSLDPGTAAELIKGMNTTTVHEIAVEVAYLEQSGYRAEASGGAVVREFCETLVKRQEAKPKSFLGHMLTSAVGKDKANEITSQIQSAIKQRDPFMAIREMTVERLVSGLNGEHPQVAATILLELPLKKSMEIVGLLEESARGEAVRRMTNPEAVPWEAKQKMAAMVEKKISLMMEKERSKLRGLGKELREGLVRNIEEKDPELASGVMDQMVMWDDIPLIKDRSLQEGLKGVDPKRLATMFIKADERIVRKVRANISERAATMVDEESSFMKDVPKEEIAKARDAMVATLRELNAKGQIAFQD